MIPNTHNSVTTKHLDAELKHLEEWDRQEFQLQAMKLKQLKNEFSMRINKLEALVGQYMPYYEKYENMRQLLEQSLARLEQSEWQSQQQQAQLVELTQQHELRVQTLMQEHNKQMIDLEMQAFEQISQLKQELSRMRVKQQQPNMQLKQLILNKEQNNIELLQQMTQQQLTINKQQQKYQNQHELRELCTRYAEDYDEAVKRIQQFERELAEYRTENIELKKYVQYLLDK